ncbi:MAG TPA: peptide-methionine (S)-S-oxide reductase MsrA [Gemmatimonadaceae bacterium]|jgi:peptide-methionine (S)-S-oxide reductase|nr:peptide-methionine (S)-S-oxide reductase MsrA [Gemmatimonadaceae bacterium]
MRMLMRSAAAIALATGLIAASTPEVHAPAKTETIVFAGGCFWGIQSVFQHTKGVVSATSGYAGGNVAKPSYEDVSSGQTGHAESVKVVFDPSQVSYEQLLKIFFSVAHDPTELNRQGPDVGTQYRSAVFYLTDAQKQETEAYIAQLGAAHAYKQPIVTQVAKLKEFYRAEDYHQNYAELHPDQPYIAINDAPKVVNLKKSFPQLYTDKLASHE